MSQHQPHLGRIGLLFASLGGILGSGWLFGPLYAAQLAGPAALIAWGIGGLMMLIVAMTFAELGAMLPLNGGITRYSLLSYGRTSGFLASLGAWLTFTVIIAAEVQALLQYATLYLPWLTRPGPEGTHPLTPSGFACAAGLWVLFSLINWRGVKLFAQINDTLTWLKIALVVVVSASFIALSFRWNNFDDLRTGGFLPEGISGIFRALAYGGVIYAYTGFQHAAIAAGQSKNPHRDVPLAVITSILFCMICYLAIQTAFLGALRDTDIKNGWQAISFSGQIGPLAGLAKILGAAWLFYFVFAGAILSPLGAGLVNLGSSLRIARGMSHDRYLPRRLSRLGRYQTPGLLITLSFPIGLFLFLPFPGWQDLVAFLTSVAVIAYAMGPLSLMALRKQLPKLHRPFRLMGAQVICPLAFVICGLLIYWSGWSVVWKLGLTFAVCGSLFMVTQRLRRETIDFLSGAWIFPFLGGLVLLTWLSGHGGLEVMGHGWGTVSVASWCLVCYYVALSLANHPAQTQLYFDLIEAAQREG